MLSTQHDYMYPTHQLMYHADLILPIENQVRELDAKLLLACTVAQRGYSVIIGWKSDIEQGIYRFRSGSLYLAKSFAPVNLKMLRILKELGHHVIAWDEEGLVHYPPDIYFGRRFTGDILPYVDRIIAWGEDNAQLLQQYQSPFPLPIHVLGNPRGDLLRSELRPFFESDVKNLVDQYGDYILVNTNFPSVNCFDPTLNTCHEDNDAPEGLALGRGSRGMPESFARGRYAHVKQLFEKFQELLPFLAETYPTHTIVLRPHPSENQELWKQEVKHYPNIILKATGNVIPWILGSTVLIHNGCTTAVEAFAMDKPVISYEPYRNERYDNHLPTDLSESCTTLEQLNESLAKYLINPMPQTSMAQHQELSIFLASMNGTLACEHIAELIDSMKKNGSLAQKPLTDRLRPLGHAVVRHAKKKFKRLKGNLQYSQAFQQQRFPDLNQMELNQKVDNFNRLLQFRKPLQLEPLQTNIIRITTSFEKN
ncbi:surface carbohydrate biosynthesis protein [Nitrospira sp. M1]